MKKKFSSDLGMNGLKETILNPIKNLEQSFWISSEKLLSEKVNITRKKFTQDEIESVYGP